MSKSNGLNVILMHDDGRTWRCRIRTAWIKFGLYTILGMFLASGVGLFGSFFFWQKLTRISSENQIMQSKIADMQPRLNRLLVFERILDDYDEQQTLDAWQRHNPSRISDVGMDVGMARPGVLPGLLPPVTDGFPPAIPPDLPIVDAKNTAPDHDAAESREVRETVADASLDEGPAHSMVTPMPAGDLSASDHELAEGHAPDETVGTSPPEPGTPDEPVGHRAEADNVRLSLRDEDMELHFDLHNRSDTTIAGRIAVSFIAKDDHVVQAEGDQRALWFRIQFFREVRSPLHLPSGYSIGEMSAIRIDVVSRVGDILYSQTYPLSKLLPSPG